MTASLSETFDPPSTTAYGRSVELVSCSSTLTSVATSVARVVRQQRRDVVHRGLLAVHDAEAVGHERPRRTVGALTSSANSLASASRSASSLLVSRGSKRMFSTISTSPSVRPSARASASEPTTSPAS